MNNKNSTGKFIVKSILKSMWTMSSNYLAGALLA